MVLVCGPKSSSSWLCMFSSSQCPVPSIYTSFLRFFLEGTAAAYAFSTPEGDLPASIAIAWSLWAIFAHQTGSGFVHWTALVFSILTLIWVVKGITGIIVKGRGRIALSDEERAPLVGS